MFLNSVFTSTLDKLGFTRINGFSFQTINELQKLFDTHFTNLNPASDLLVTHNNTNDVNLSFQIHEAICKIVESDLKNLLKGHQVFASHFVVKKAKNQGAFQLHQDWSITDENKYRNFQIWIPLNASYPENGGLCFVPESHSFLSNLRSGSLSIPRIPITKEVYPYLSYCRLFKGEAVAFYSRTLHGSFINSSPEDRVGVILNILEENTPTYYYHKISDGKIQKHQIDTKTLFENLHFLEKGELPFNQLISEEKNNQYPNSDIDFDFILSKIRQIAKEKNRADNYEHKEVTILKNEELEHQINKNGFAIIEFLTSKEIDLLKTTFENFFPDRTLFSGSFSSMSALDNEQRKNAHKAIQAIIQERLELLFEDFECPISLLYSRRPDGKHKLDWHTDPAFNLNEHYTPIYGIWCPLQEVNEASGGLKIIPGGHRIIPKLNLSYTQWKWPLEEYRELLNDYGKSFNLTAGQAIIFDTRMIHGSDPNTSKMERDNIVMRILPKNSNYFKFIRSNQMGGQLFQVSSNHFFTASAKDHQLTPEENQACDFMYTFEYELTKTEIESYFSGF